MKVAIDKFIIDNTKCPNYCRDEADKVCWMALKLGRTDIIRTRDKVSYDSNYNHYVLEVSGL